jgi:DNA-directed RNA polymerase specialized sigma24 family protein
MPPEGRPAPDPVEHALGPADTEASLLARAQASDVGAFERLSGAYADRVCMLLRRLLGDRSEAEDVTQEVMLRAWQGITRFRASPATSPGCTGLRSARPTARWSADRGARRES